MSDFWNIAVNVPMHEPLTYATPQELSGVLQRGMLVDVPLGTKKGVKGLLLSPAEKAPEGFEIKAIQSIDPEYQVLPDSFVRWIEWMAHYYVYPIGHVMTSAYPPLERTTTQRKSRRPPVVPVLENKGPLHLTPQQQEAFDSIRKSSGFSTHLLFGVTGSGKTEVYLRLLQEIMDSGKQGMVLVPEISLTPQLVHRFAERFGDQIAVLHSQLTDRERTNQWWEMVEGRKKILIGARSALFCPLPNLGLIIVDEEHEPSYKQEEKLKYHGRDAAVMLGKFSNCPVVLGSATPSLESWRNTIEGRYQLHRMSQRVQDRALPTVEILDLRTMEKDPALPFWLSPILHQAIHDSLTRKEQVALFLNRRGVANVVLCPSCGFTHECPNCDITLTLHGRHHLVCHYCDYHEEYKLDCPSCKIGEVSPMGLGTELLETEMQRLFPEAKTARADRDEIQNRHDLEELVRGMESGETDILIGTQMIAKGLDFPRLNLVGLVLADVGFNLPDFRATERSFQLITQVSGRAGRHVKPGEPPGRVIIQTYNPEHPSLTFAQKHDFESFSQMEIAQREPLAYPPIGKLISFRIQGTQLSRVQEAARLLSVRSQQLKIKHQAYENVEVLGPAEAPLAKLRGQFRYHLLLKGKDHRHLQSFCRQVLGDQKWLPPATRISVDVDPLQLL